MIYGFRKDFCPDFPPTGQAVLHTEQKDGKQPHYDDHGAATCGGENA